MANQNYKIREARIADLPKLKPLWLEFMEYHATLDQKKYRFLAGDWPRVLKRFSRSLHEENAVFYLAENEQHLLGYAFGFVFFNYPGFFPPEVGFVSDFIVTKSFRSRGVGKALFVAMEEWFRRQGVQIIQLYVAASNLSGRKFWRDRGFEHYSLGLWKEIATREVGDEGN